MITDTNATPSMNLKLVPKESSVDWICVVDEDEGDASLFLLLRFDAVVKFDPMSLDFTSLELSLVTCNVPTLALGFVLVI